MSSIDQLAVDSHGVTRARALPFFREKLVPAAERLRERGVQFFPLAPVPEQCTWFVPYRVSPEDELDAVGPTSDRLVALWAEIPELAELAPALFALAQEIHPLQSEKAEVSPCFYVMF